MGSWGLGQHLWSGLDGNLILPLECGWNRPPVGRRSGFQGNTWHPWTSGTWGRLIC